MGALNLILLLYSIKLLQYSTLNFLLKGLVFILWDSRGEMSIEAVLNVEADRLAGKYQDELGVYSLITHMYPLSLAVRGINGMTITSNIRHHLIKAYAEPKYMRYLRRKNKWNRKTVQMIA